MAERIRFHLDESVSPAVARGLRRRGVDVTTSQEMGLLHESDDAQIRFACGEGRVLVTHDKHFFALAAQEREYPGLVFCEMHSRSVGEIVRNLALLHDTHTPEDMAGRVEYL